MPSTSRARPLLRPREVASRLSVSVQTLRNWSRPGEPLAHAVFVLPSGQRRYDAAAVEAFIASRKGAA